jgi:hypothetical protein
MKKKLALMFTTMVTLSGIGVNKGFADEIDPMGYVSQSYTNQMVTAYPGSGQNTYHGTVPRKYITAAVRPVKCGDPKSGTKFTFHTILTTKNDLQVESGVYKNRFDVEDMVDQNCNLPRRTPYFFDIYFGPASDPAVLKKAGDFGEKFGIDYTALIPL